MNSEFKNLKYIHSRRCPTLGRFVLVCRVVFKGVKRNKNFELTKLNDAKKWVDIQLLRFGRPQEYNSFKQM